MDISSYILAACCHDLEHPGLSNLFLIESRHKLALRYNDISVLENHHVATTFDIMNRENQKYDIFDNYNPD